jgi:hypothetical protein
MERFQTAGASAVLADEGPESAVAWGAVIAGAAASTALMLLLLAFGVGVGFSVVSPWADSGVSATTFSIGAGIYLLVVAMIGGSVGGYLAGRLRTRWVGVHADEVFFRDTAHGFLTWAFGTVVNATILAAAATHILAGASVGLFQAGATAATQSAGNNGGPMAIYVDQLLRPGPSGAAGATPGAAGAAAGSTNQNAGDATATRAETTRIFTGSVAKGADFSAADRAYLAQVVSARTGMSQADADRRVQEVTGQAKAAADAARKSAAKFSLWIAASLLAGAFFASLAAIEGGQLQDRYARP